MSETRGGGVVHLRVRWRTWDWRRPLAGGRDENAAACEEPLRHDSRWHDDPAAVTCESCKAVAAKEPRDVANCYNLLDTLMRMT